MAFSNRIHRIYIDGKRIASRRIHVLGSGSSLVIDKSESFNDSSTILIFQQAMDTELSPYGYDKTSPEYMYYDSMLLTGTKKFRDWILQEYKE